MASTDMFDAAGRIMSDIRGLSPNEAKKAILMALIASEMEGLLIDPHTIGGPTLVKNR